MISVVQCPKCGWLQASSASKTFKCRKCNASRQLRKVKVVKVVNNPSEARAVIQYLRKKGH